MESRIFVLLLSGLGLLNALSASAQDADDDPAVIDPDLDRREVKEPRIDTENFEVGPYGGILSIEDFGANAVVGLRFAYHITEGLFVEAGYAQTSADRTSFEVLSGATQLLTDTERDYTYYNLSFGYNILPGEVFLGKHRAFTNAIYLVAGAGNTTFAGDEHFTVNFGAGTQFLPTDWLAVHIGVRDHLFDTDLLGAEKTTHNLEMRVGLSIFF